MPLNLDIDEFECLFHSNYKQLCLVSYRIVLDKDAAEDIVQEIFCNIWERQSTLQIKSINAYLHQSVVHQSVHHLKKIKHQHDREDFFGSEIGGDVNSTENLLSAKELNTRIQTAIDALPNGCRTVFMLSRFENYSYRQIASELGISIKTVENQIGRALKHLKKCLLLFLIFILKYFFV